MNTSSKITSNGKAEKSARTRARIIAAATPIFVRDGYTKAALNDIITSAKITTGAVYHHFGDKKGLFQAVAESLEQDILDHVSARINLPISSWDQFEEGIIHTLEVCARPDIQRIVFGEASSVIGIQEWRNIEMKYAFGLMHQVLTDLTQAGIINTTSSDMTAQIILGAVIEAANSVAQAKNKTKALQSAKSTLTLMLHGLKADNH